MLTAVDDRQQLRLPDQIDLVQDRDDRDLQRAQQAEEVLLAAARLLRHVEHHADDVHVAHRVERGVHHPHVHPVRRLVNARRVDEHDLPVRIVADTEDAVARGLRLVGDDGELRADEAVEQRGLAGVRQADERDETRFHAGSLAGCAAGSCTTWRRTRTRVTRRRSASSTSTRSPSTSNPLPHRGHTAEVRQQVAADRAEPFGRNADTQPIVQVVDADLAAEDEHAVALVLHGLGLDVVLVANLADDLLEQVLDRDQARRAAVLVDDDRRLHLLALELLQQVGHRLVSGTKCAGRSRRSTTRVACWKHQRQADEVLDEDEAEDVVERVAVDRHARVLLLGETPAAARPASRRHCADDVGTRRHDLTDERVAEVDDRLQQPALLALDQAFLLACF